jgi:hypothetical protein
MRLERSCGRTVFQSSSNTAASVTSGEELAAVSLSTF